MRLSESTKQRADARRSPGSIPPRTCWKRVPRGTTTYYTVASRGDRCIWRCSGARGWLHSWIPLVLPFGRLRRANDFRERTVTVSQRSYIAKPGEVKQTWYVVDATDQILGRLASDIAVILMGKNKPTYTPNSITGDVVVVLNAEKVQMTGRKMSVRHYTWYTGYPGLRLESYRDRLARRPGDLIQEAVRRMLPKNDLARRMLMNLKIYSGTEHPHQAQQCKAIELGQKITD
jgi:large subunit ribosomal protein L13